MEKIKVKSKVVFPVYFEGEVLVEDGQDKDSVRNKIIVSAYKKAAENIGEYLKEAKIDVWWTRFE